MRPADIFTVLNQELASVHAGQHTPVMLWGPPGVGKSQLISQLGQKNTVPVIDLRLSQLEPSDLRGIPFRDKQGVEWAIPNMLPDADRQGERGILFLDEITSAPPSVSAAAYQLILDRRLGDYSVPDGWAIFAAGNRQGDRGVTYTMPAPLANRFSHYTVEVHLDDWAHWAYSNGIDERLIAFLRFKPELIFDFDPAANPVAFPSPRSWEFAHRGMQKFQHQPRLLLQALQACVGDAAGVELKAFLDNLEQMPDIDEIVTGRSQVMPEEMDVQYAVAAALVGRAIRERDSEAANTTLGHILDYAQHFPQREMSVMLISDLQRVVGQQLFILPQFAQWADQVADLLLDA